MNGKRTLALLLAVSVATAAASILAEGAANGPAPDPSDLPTAGAWEEYADETDVPSESAADAEARFVAGDAAAQYDSVTGQWTLAELASMDAPPVTGDAKTDEALESQWRTLREALENAPPDADTNAVLEAAAVTTDAESATDASDAPADGPALTGDAKTDSQLEAAWNAAHPVEAVPETPQAVANADDTPEGAAIAGPDDGGARPERTLDKNDQRDAQKRERIVADAAETAETLSEISFAEVESRTRAYNMTVRAMEERISGAESVDYKKAEDDLLKSLNALAAQEEALMSAASSSIGAVAGGAMSGNSALMSLQTQYNSAYKSFEQIRDGTTRRNAQDGIRQLQMSVEQIVMGAETSYIALVAMQDQYAAYARQLEALNRTVEEMELRYSLGQISALTLNQTKSGRTALMSGMETLSMNIRSLKMRLENMLGASLTGEIKLGALPAVTEAQIAALDADRDFAAANEKSYELYAAARTLQDARETFLDSASQYHYNESNSSYQMAQHTWTAAQDTYNVTVRGYELKFRTLYEQVRDYYQVWNASKDALEMQKQLYQVSELQYKQGNISQNALLSAKDSLSEKEEAVRTAANNLFSSYNNYCWAVQSGILN